MCCPSTGFEKFQGKNFIKMKTFSLLLVVLVASGAFAWPNHKLRETEQPQNENDDSISEEEFEQVFFFN